MKIEFYRTIWWKLTLYYIFVILVGAVLHFVLTTRSMGKYLEEDYRKNMENQTARIVKILLKSRGKDEGIDQIKENFYDLADISRLSIKLVNANGEIVAQSQRGGGPPHPGMGGGPGGPRPGNRGREPFFSANINLTNEEIGRLKKGEKIYYEKTDKRGGKFLFLCYPIAQKGEFFGALIVETPVGPPSHFRMMFLDSVFISTIVAFILALFLSRDFVKPIRVMEKSVRAISQGDFSRKINLKRKDEFGFLADAFDDMSTKLEKNLKSRMMLMMDISHELNTPLTNVRAIAEAMYDGLIETPEDRKKNLESILKQVERLSYLINDTRELSKFEAGEITISKTAFNVLEPIGKVLESIEILAREKDIVVESVVENKNLAVFGDPDRITQAIQNLVNNAIQHNHTGIKVTISAKDTGDKVLFSVEDNGKGIAADEVEKIFERFYKVDKSRSSGISGSGLGLAIVKNIIAAHDETISINSSDKGTKFFFYLPKSDVAV